MCFFWYSPVFRATNLSSSKNNSWLILTGVGTTKYVYIYMYIIYCIYYILYIYNIYIYIYSQTLCFAVAKIVICHFRNLHFVQAKHVCCYCHSEKMHFNLRPPMNLSTCILRGRRGVFAMVVKYNFHFRWQAREILAFFDVLKVRCFMFFWM
jgi:hypothetical protein